jgi:hypothetical protein
VAANDLGRHKDDEEAGVAIVNKCIQECLNCASTGVNINLVAV